MSERKPSLSQLYRRFAGSPAVGSVPDAEDVLQLARLPHADAAAAPVCADLLRFSRELEADSMQLSNDVASAFAQHTPALHRQAPPRRFATAAARRWRAVGALAASVLAIVAVSTALRHAGTPAPIQQSAAQTPVLQDRIFAAFNDERMAVAAPPDEIFRDQFSASSDVIFRDHNG